MQRRAFSEILRNLRTKPHTAEAAVDAVEVLRAPRYAADLAEYLVKDFGRDPRTTRVLIRAAGKSRSRELHDLLAQKLMDAGSPNYAYELIDALSATGIADYAAAIVPFLESAHHEPIQSTAAYALGILRSPVAIRPLIQHYRRSRSRKAKALCLQALRRIVGGPSRPVSLDLYLSDAPKKTRDQILQAVGSAA
ncbi:MAG TPA: HEAT repeat domain-containing protein [Planctomycetaceae bacterium]|nr:HEAT repeat domain-containing protein [Planctomycetaceae bacterium]